MREINNGNIPYRSIAVLLFTVLLSSCLKETAVPIESAFSIESSEDKTSPVTIQLKMKVTGQTNMNRHQKEDCLVVLRTKARVRLCSRKPVSTNYYIETSAKPLVQIFFYIIIFSYLYSMKQQLSSLSFADLLI